MRQTKSFLVDPSEWVQRLHVLIIGPGLGRNEVETVSSVIQNVNLPMIIDADGQGKTLINNVLAIQNCSNYQSVWE